VLTVFVPDRRKKILGEPRYGFATVKWGYGWFEDCDHIEPPAMSLEFTDDCESE